MAARSDQMTEDRHEIGSEFYSRGSVAHILAAFRRPKDTTIDGRYSSVSNELPKPDANCGACAPSTENEGKK